jgi:gas vesicle structural protein
MTAAARPIPAAGFRTGEKGTRGPMTAGEGGYLDRPGSSSLADVVETLLDKGMVVDVYARISLMGVELVTLDARVVVASVDSYLRFAEAVNRLDLADKQIQGISGLVEDTAEAVVAGTITGVKEGAAEGLSDVKDAAEEGLRDLFHPFRG